MKRAIISAWVGAGNVGDELILSATLALLRHRGLDVVVPSLNPAETEATHQVRALHHLDIQGLQRALRRCDLLVFGGGGLVQDRSSPWSPLYQCARPRRARQLGIPVLALGIGAEPLRQPTSRWAVREALTDHVGVVARDSESAEVLRSLGVSQVRVGADLALTLTSRPIAPAPRIVTCLRNAGEQPGLLPSVLRRQALEPTRIANLASQLRDLSDASGLPVSLVAMDGRRDLEFANAVARELGDAAEKVVAPTVEQLLGEVGASHLVVTTRYHGAVAAALTSRPAVLFGYAPKVVSLSKQLPRSTRLLPDSPSGYRRLTSTAMQLLGQDPPRILEEARELRDAAAVNTAALDEVLRER